MEERLVFGESCPQHPEQRVASATRQRVEWGGRAHWLVTVAFGCGHRHTQHAAAPPDRVWDTAGAAHAVADETP